MDFVGHVSLGLVWYYIFKLAGLHLDFWMFLIGLVILDIDHILGFLYKTIRKSWTIGQKRLRGWQKISFFPRTVMHSFYGIGAAGIIAFYVTNSKFLTISLILGIIVHLLIDSYDEHGVAWFYPYFRVTGPLPASYIKGRTKIGGHKINKRLFYWNSAILGTIIVFKIIF